LDPDPSGGITMPMDRVRPADPASKATRAIVRREFDAAVAAAGRLPDPSDAEALHDCRVALRRLRVALKAYAPMLRPGVPKGLRQALSALADHTGPARDAEVFIAWLSDRIPRLPAASRAAAAWVLERMIARRDAAYRSLRRVIPKVLGMIDPLLRAGLALRGRARSGRSAEPTFARFTAQCAGEQLEALTTALDKIHGPADEGRAHRARIATKKLRYLLEPALSSRGRGILKPLKTVQDRLGEFHDLGAVRTQLALVRRWRAGGYGPARSTRATLARVEASAERERLALFRVIQREILRVPRAWLVPVTRWTRRHEASAIR
jgi:CHAD domain-containing protein